MIATRSPLKSLEGAGEALTVTARPRAAVIVPSRDLGEQVTKVFKRPGANGIEKKEMTVNLFTWEKLDSVDKIRAEFAL